MINSGDTACVLASAALVLFMTPGLAIFYAGMVRAKSALNMMMMSFAAIGVTTIIWVLYGYSLTIEEIKCTQHVSLHEISHISHSN